jgi:hypothetical protein
MADSVYDKIYRRMHPRQFPYSAFERQSELSDLWPAEQTRFRKMVDATVQSVGLRDDFAIEDISVPRRGSRL